MKVLYLVRHAKSSWADPDQADFDRPLNSRGKKDAKFMGNKLAEQGVLPDLIICSPAKRTKKTFKKIAKRVGYDKERVVYDERIYEASPEILLDILAMQNTKSEDIMLIGHNPGLTYLTNDLCSADIANLPTTGIVCIQFPITEWSEILHTKGKLLFFDYPKRYLTDNTVVIKE
jgi:phosphohistidine phosphatase